MKTIGGWFLAAALAGAMGCGSSRTSTCPDCGCGDERPRLWGLSRGLNVFTITSISDVNDGCMIAPSNLVDTGLMIDYVEATHVLSIGAMAMPMAGTPPAPTLGSAAVAGNLASLSNEYDNADGTGCTWHQADVSMFALFNHDKFTLAVKEDRSAYASACTFPPPAGTCTSSWTWTVEKRN
jgi:hypothetical protein